MLKGFCSQLINKITTKKQLIHARYFACLLVRVLVGAVNYASSTISCQGLVVSEEKKEKGKSTLLKEILSFCQSTTKDDEIGA